MSTGSGDPAREEPGEEELRAAYEAEIKRVRVEQLLLENIVTLVNMGMRRTGLAPGTEDERDPEQVRVAIEGVRALLPVLEGVAAPQAGAIRDALSQLQLAYVRIGGGPGGDGPAFGGGPAGAGGGPAESGPGQGEPVKPGEAGPAQRSGRLWIPGQ